MGADYRREQIKKQADAMLEKWNSYQSQLPASIRESFKEASLEKIVTKAGEKIVEGLGGGLTGAVITHSVLGALSGLMISMVVVTGVNAYRQRRNHPLRYLNRIQNATDRSFGSLYVPQWTALASN
jgi:hypothetical protein